MPVKGLDAFLMPWKGAADTGTGDRPRTRRGSGRQDRVNARQQAVNAASGGRGRPLTGSVIENLVAGIVGTALLAYLVYALVRPERF